MPSAELLPCPIPFPWEHAPTSGGSRRRFRFRRRRALELMVNLQICSLNFVFLGGPPKCPTQGCRGDPCKAQQDMIKSLWDRNCSNCRLAEDLSSGCSNKLLGVQSELAAFDVAFDSLRDLVYGAAKQRASSSAHGTSTEVVPLVAQNVAFPSSLRGFEAGLYLPEPFMRPQTLIAPGLKPSVSPPSTMNQCELWHLCWRWDSVGRLTLALKDEILPGSVSNLFCLQKPDGELRQIIDRRPGNSIETPPPTDAPRMGRASVFLGLQVPKDGCIRGSVDDLRNFYHEFEISSERAVSTPVGPLWFARDFSGSAALEELRKRRPDMRVSCNTRVYSCFAGLSMGDHWAPAIAQVAHEQLLIASGALVPEEHLILGLPEYASMTNFLCKCLTAMFQPTIHNWAHPAGIFNLWHRQMQPTTKQGWNAILRKGFVGPLTLKRGGPTSMAIPALLGWIAPSWPCSLS